MSNFSPHNRRSVRLKEYDYTAAGAYFINLATHAGVPLFGEVTVDQILLNPFGKVVEEEWLRTPEVRSNLILDEFVIMPNHLHGIIFLTGPVGAHSCAPLQDPQPPIRSPNKSLSRPPKSIGSFVAGFKSIVTKRINLLRSTPGMPVWQRNYYEHIIRDKDDLERIREYIRNNPIQWETDHEYTKP